MERMALTGFNYGRLTSKEASGISPPPKLGLSISTTAAR
jgi:hypothetical protein